MRPNLATASSTTHCTTVSLSWPADVGLDGKDLDAVRGLERFLGSLELGHVAPGDNQVRALLGEGDVDAVPDGTCEPVLKRCLATAGDDDGLACEVSPGLPLSRARMRARIEIACAERTHPSEAPNRDHGIDDEWRQNLGIRLRWGI